MSKRREIKDARAVQNPERYVSSLLSHGVWTKAEALGKLRARGVSEEEAVMVVEKFGEAGLFDDEAYAFLFVESHPEWGVYRLQDELRRRGVASEYIQRALEKTDEEENALCLAAEWFRNGMDPRKIEGRLLRRGFSRGACRNALERACEGEL